MALEFLLIGIIILVVLGILIGIGMFNSIIILDNRIENAWAQIDVQLKKRSDLIPNLVNTVKGYAKHESTTLKEITEARNISSSAKTRKEKAQASNILTHALKSLIAISESYPDLKASKNFLMLQEELSGIESKIAYARQFYNDSVLQFNTSIETIPTNFIAGILNFKEKDYFETEESERKNPEVKF